MDIVFHTLTRDKTLRMLITQYPRLSGYVNEYIKKPYSTMSRGNSQLINWLNDLLLPGVLAYICYNNEIDIFYPKGNLTWGLRHSNKKVESKMGELFSHLNALLPRVPNEDLSLISNELQERIKKSVKKFQKWHKLHHHSFWNICQIFYGIMPKNKFYIPSCTGMEKFYLTKYTARDMDELFKYIYEVAARNTHRWKTVKTDMLAENPDDIRLNDAYPENMVHYVLRPQEDGNNYQVAKDLITATMKLESWELFTYYDSSRRCFRYLPHKEAIALSHQMTFAAAREQLKQGHDENIVNAIQTAGFKFFIKQLTFIIGLYGFNGTITENAHIILYVMNSKKHELKQKRLFDRGFSRDFWSPKPPEDYSFKRLFKRNFR
ncbi:hypothetical protein P0136_03335 [Lentisphaerota bacterium ZTH]|nr:hypothetical protein JYG24_05535 [Lentisphaerota bacterium]WET07034.1 hypothetical protein P0136_03335 [Lentisphaerota bacterium ZTH]